MDLFYYFEIETCSSCNLRCATCPVSSHPRPAHYLEEALFTKAVDELARLQFSGYFSPHFYNEPLLDQRLPELLRYAHRTNPLMRIVLFTNTTLLSPALYRELLHAGVEEFVVTIDNPVINNSYQRLAAELTAEEKGRLRARSIAKDALSNRGGAMDIAGLEPVRKCKIPSYYLTIDAFGRALPCYNDYHAANPLGDLHVQGLQEIWEQERFRRLRENVLQGRMELPICQACQWSPKEDEE